MVGRCCYGCIVPCESGLARSISGRRLGFEMGKASGEADTGTRAKSYPGSSSVIWRTGLTFLSIDTRPLVDVGFRLWKGVFLRIRV